MPKRAPRFEIYRSPKDRQFYARFKAANGQIVWQTEGYKRLAGARNAIRVLMTTVVEEIRAAAL